MPRSQGKDQPGGRGSALAMTLLFISTFSLMTAAVGSMLSRQVNDVNKAGVEKRTRYAAYSAIQIALARLNQDRLWDPGELITDIPMFGDPQIRYTLRVYNNWSGAFPNPAPDGVWVPHYMVYLKSTGDFGGISSGRLTAGMASMGYIGDSYFNYAATGTSGVILENNSVTDSYRTCLNGTSAAQGQPVRNHPVMSTPPWERGNVITNAKEAGINITNSTVKGHAVVGPGSDPNLAFVINGTGGGTGGILYERKVNTGIKRVPRYVPPYDPANAVSPVNFSGGSASLPAQGYSLLTATNGVTVRMGPGNYYFQNTVTFNDAILELEPSVNRDHPCTLYVGRTVTFNNSTINVAMGSANTGGGGLVAGPMTLRIFFVGNGAPGFSQLALNVTDSKAYFCAAGKGMVGTLVDSELFGSLKGTTIRLNNSTIHYDKDVFNYLNMGTVAWNLQGLVTDAGDVMDDGGDVFDGGGGG